MRRFDEGLGSWGQCCIGVPYDLGGVISLISRKA